MWFLFFTGFVALAAQVVLLRELSVTFYGVELVYTLAIGAWLFWTAVGAALDWGRERPPSVDAIGALLAAGGVLTVAAALLARAALQLMGGTPGAYLPVGQQFVTLIVGFLPVGVTLGLLFQWAARRVVAHGPEAQGRIHTSTVTVAVMPEAEDIDVQVNPADIEMDVFRSTGSGGHSVNTTDSAVRLTHKPTGVVVKCQQEKSQTKTARWP